jgi:hypothetical protein
VQERGPDTKEKKPGPLVMRGTLHHRALGLGFRKRMVRKFLLFTKPRGGVSRFSRMGNIAPPTSFKGWGKDKRWGVRSRRFSCVREALSGPYEH